MSKDMRLLSQDRFFIVLLGTVLYFSIRPDSFHPFGGHLDTVLLFVGATGGQTGSRRRCKKGQRRKVVATQQPGTRI
jgi:hypothetical protein